MSTEVSRRGFLKAALLTALSAGLLGTPTGLHAAQALRDEHGMGGRPWGGEPPQAFLSQASAATFAPLIGSTFHLKTATGGVAFTLTEVTPVQSYPTHDSFSLLFRAPDGVTPVSDTYTVEHATLGTLYLFLSPIGASGQVYEACFARLRNALV